MKNKSRKDILLIITYIALIIFGLVNFEKILSFLSWIINAFSPFLIGTLLAFILNVLVNFIERRIFGRIKDGKVWSKIKRPISISLSVVTVIFIIFLVFNLLIPQLQNSVSLFSESLPEYKEDVLGVLNRFDVDEESTLKVSEYLDNFGKVITDFIKDNSKDVISATTEVAASVIKIVSKGIIAIVFAIYILAQKEKLKYQADKVMSAFLKPKIIDKIKKIANEANKTFSSFVTGQCLEAIILGCLCFIGMMLLRFDYEHASAISVLIGFTALVPIFGPIVGTVLGALLLVMVNPVRAIIFVVFVLILQQIDDNLIYPKIVGMSVGLPGMWVLLSVTVGAAFGGIIGMIIATPLCSLLYSLFTGVVNERINKNKIVTKVVEKKTS